MARSFPPAPPPPPTLSITNPSKSGERWSNSVFTVTGTAKDNVGVADVLVALNGGDWQPATTTNNWTNWTAQINLIPGTNVLQAYAVDTSGNDSITNTVKLDYILSATLTVGTNGDGIISPDYNGVPLQISNTYSMTAMPARGFGFVNWTDGLDNVITNGATLEFVMASNLTFVANFVDITKPTLSITNPKTGQKWSNAVFTVKGTASDNVAVASVWYQFNTNAWALATGTNNWTAVLALTTRSNTVKAYAVDTSGNVSLTNSVSFLYILSDRLTVRTNGLGSITPNDNGALLEIGQTYTLTAKAGTGFAFTNWTGSLTTNKAALTFLMASNLSFTANFVDVQKPVLTITNLTSGQRWSNATFTVKGKASDNVAVASVWYQFNTNAWALATGTNNWTAVLALTTRSNTVKAYAVDTSGNVSLTNSVSFLYILSDRLTVRTNGLGSITPNDNGALLEIGQTYTLTAKAGTGFAFYYWGGGVPMSVNPTLTFIMASNLTITANFKDVTKPVATITFPVTNQKWSNSVITVTGKASDNVGVTSVGIQINNGGWAEAGTANGFTNWTAANLPVIFGTNIVQAYAVDAAGNVSLTNKIKFLGVLAPASLSGYAATVKRSGGQPNVVVTWGDSTWSQTGTGNDTNADDYCAGSYTYMQTGPNTAVLTNMDIGMLSWLGTTNVTTVNLTFTSATSANCAWTNENDSGTGTMTFSQVSNLVPASLAGETIQTYESNGAAGAVITFNTGGTFNETEGGGGTGFGTYTFTQYSPTVAIIQQDYSDANDAGAVGYAELTFTSATAGRAFHSFYQNPTYGSNPDVKGLGTFKVK